LLRHKELPQQRCGDGHVRVRQIADEPEREHEIEQ
jgi:hypothetical protein